MFFSNSKKAALPKLKGKNKPYIMAHRGNQVLCPENTLSAFSQAIADGADIIETDLHLSKDCEFVCIHDSSVDRTTNGTGPVAEKTLTELKMLSAGFDFPDYAWERIPTLKETLDIIPDNMALALELKTDAFLETSVCEKLIKILAEADIIDRTLIISFSIERVKAVKTVSPDIISGWITLTQMRPKKGLEVLGPYWRILLSNPFYVFLAHLQNQAVCPLDNMPDSRLWLYKLLGCDAVITDDPQKTAQKLKKKGQNRQP